MSHLVITTYLLCSIFAMPPAGLHSLITANSDIHHQTYCKSLRDSSSRIDTIPPSLLTSASTIHPRAFSIRSDDGWMINLNIVKVFVPPQSAARVLRMYISECFPSSYVLILLTYTKGLRCQDMSGLRRQYLD